MRRSSANLKFKAFRILKLTLGVIILSILLLEICLRLFSSLLPLSLANLMSGKYHFYVDGIYFADDDMYHIMKPNFRQEMFFNGYRWHHQTNKIGIRDNRDIEGADIVALGDSMIYGHGVNIEDTLCFHLEKISGLTVANLGIQADYPVGQYIRLKRLGLFFKPKVVLFFVNRTQDEEDFLLCQLAEDYIDKIISEPAPDYSKGIEFSDYLKYYKKPSFNLAELRHRSYLLRAAFNIRYILQEDSQRDYLNDPEIEIHKLQIKNFLRKILLSAKTLCETNNSQMIVILNGLGFNYKEDDPRFNEFCRWICIENNILFLDLNDANPQEDYHLINDGHYSPEGNRWAAENVYKFLKDHKIIVNKIYLPAL